LSEIESVLEEHLATIEKEIARLADLASAEQDFERQQQLWDLARDLQREAREIRSRIVAASQSRSEMRDRSKPRVLPKTYFALGGAAAGFLSTNCC
jgi:ferritin